MFRKQAKPRRLTPSELESLKQFANCEITLDKLLGRITGTKIDFGSAARTLTSHYVVPEPGIQIGLGHIRKAKEKLPSNDLTNWATMILLNDAYVWEGADEDEVADKLHELSLPQIFSSRPKHPE
jgi:hypothetical protein